MLCPTHDRICQLRRANIGASTVLSSVSPVLPSLPPITVRRSVASSSSAGIVAPSDGGKLTNGHARSSAAYAYSELDGSTGVLRSRAALRRSSDECTSPVSKGGSVDDTLTTTT